MLSGPRVQASDHHTCCCEKRTASWAFSRSFPRPESLVSPFSLEQLTTLRGSILEDATPTAMKHGTGRGLPLRDALEYVIPELNIHCLRLALNTPKVTEQLLKLDEQGVSRGPAGVGAQGQQPAAPLPDPLPSHFFFSSKEQKPTQASSSKRRDLVSSSRAARRRHVTAGAPRGDSLGLRQPLGPRVCQCFRSLAAYCLPQLPEVLLG